jgi:hypothetical protein
MPYIKQDDREYLREVLENLYERLRIAKNPNDMQVGWLNYVITSLCHFWLSGHGKLQSYKNLNEVIGALECAKQELYRTVVAPYENTKILENGPISNLDKK